MLDYALVATPLQGQIGAPDLLVSVGWGAVLPLAVGLVAVVVLAARDRLAQRRDHVPPPDDVRLDPPLAA